MQTVDAPRFDVGSEDWVLSGSERWYAVHTLPQREAIARMHLKNQAFRTFFPRFEKTVRHARKTRRTLTACSAVTCSSFSIRTRSLAQH